ncbi:hypothetical protein [Falsirhodobacter halotolerans]|uniref:hypothetical protein n=1 Tax=Falsirhodobacter halotolerans TaxID=1146892 RepID=UPI001FD36EE3|nr:hypothetical protein [Falsirhodobacter halotolerans]MCJ8141267.1 hypothetical protein [Falsirhodobacter halotolerans]
MTPSRDPFLCPFSDPDRAAIWHMLVPRDIDAFLAADFDAVMDDFVTVGFTALSAHFQPDPERYTLAFPDLATYRVEWVRQAQDFAAGSYASPPRDQIFAATRLEEIEITGPTALARKRFDGHIRRADGGTDRMNWQTLYWCRRDRGHWRIAGFLGYLPHIKDA